MPNATKHELRERFLISFTKALVNNFFSDTQKAEIREEYQKLLREAKRKEERKKPKLKVKLAPPIKRPPMKPMSRPGIQTTMTSPPQAPSPGQARMTGPMPPGYGSSSPMTPGFPGYQRHPRRPPRRAPPRQQPQMKPIPKQPQKTKLDQYRVIGTSSIIPPAYSDQGFVDTLNLGKLEPILRDPSVSSVEVPGPGKNILVNKSGSIQTTQFSLNEDEIDSMITDVSNKTRIPVSQGIYKTAVNDLLVTAVVSDYVGSRFIIQKKRPNMPPGQRI
jgi:hypothetical protein